MAFISSRQFAQIAGISQRKAGAALARIARGHNETWRGAHLAVRTIAGRGGRSGLQYEVEFESLPDALKERFKDGSKPLVVASPTIASAAKRTLHLSVLHNALSHPKGSVRRAQAILRLADQPIADPESGQLKSFSVRTLQRLVSAYDTHGVAGLGRKQRSDTGGERAIISRRWDKAAASVPRVTKEAIRAEVVSYSGIPGASENRLTESAGSIPVAW